MRLLERLFELISEDTFATIFYELSQTAGSFTDADASDVADAAAIIEKMDEAVRKLYDVDVLADVAD